MRSKMMRLILATATLMLVVGSAVAADLNLVVNNCDCSTAITERLVEFHFDGEVHTGDTDADGRITLSDSDIVEGTEVEIRVWIPPLAHGQGEWAIFSAIYEREVGARAPSWVPEPIPESFVPVGECAVKEKGDPDDVETCVQR